MMDLNSLIFGNLEVIHVWDIEKMVLRTEARSPPNKWNHQGISPLEHLGAAFSASTRLKLGLDQRWAGGLMECCHDIYVFNSITSSHAPPSPDKTLTLRGTTDLELYRQPPPPRLSHEQTFLCLNDYPTNRHLKKCIYTSPAWSFHTTQSSSNPLGPVGTRMRSAILVPWPSVWGAKGC